MPLDFELTVINASAEDVLVSVKISTPTGTMSNYTINDKLEVGIVLTGTEIKSIRAGKVNLKDSYVNIKNSEAGRKKHSKSKQIQNQNRTESREALQKCSGAGRLFSCPAQCGKNQTDLPEGKGDHHHEFQNGLHRGQDGTKPHSGQAAGAGDLLVDQNIYDGYQQRAAQRYSRGDQSQLPRVICSIAKGVVCPTSQCGWIGGMHFLHLLFFIVYARMVRIANKIFITMILQNKEKANRIQGK